MTCAVGVPYSPPTFMFHGGGDGRTYSGVWPGGQVARKPLFAAGFAALFEASWGAPNRAGTSQRFLKPDGVELSPGEFGMALLNTKKRPARKSLHQAGWITLEGGFAARQCVVKDMSATGAKVVIDDPNSLPAKLRLAFS